MVLDYFKNSKKNITEYLSEYFYNRGNEITQIYTLDDNIKERIFDFTVSGKMIRGSLVTLGYELYQEEKAFLPAVQAGAALELFQSALLIHDDIMDKDLSRRGAPSLFSQYRDYARNKYLSDPDHTGNSLGICAGDIAFFLGFEILSLLSIPESKKGDIIAFSSKELSYVGLAQMMDVFRGASPDLPEEEDIFHIYRYKTGRYTFSMPLIIGGKLGNAPESSLKLLEKIGELFGLVFQIKDDELGLFGEEQSIGKPSGSDIAEGKKTLYYINLFSLAAEEDKENLSAIFGSSEITPEEIAYVRALVKDLGIQEKIEQKIQSLGAEAQSLIDSLKGVQDEAKSLLSALIQYSINRKK